MSVTKTKNPAAQVAVAKNAAALKAASEANKAQPFFQQQQSLAPADQPPRGPPKHRTSALVERVAALKDADVGLRLLSKPEVIAITGTSFPTIWQWMRDGKFPRSRIVGGRSMWRSEDIEQWLAGLPVRPLKGDAPSEAA